MPAPPAATLDPDPDATARRELARLDRAHAASLQAARDSVIADAVARHGGNRSRAARALGLSRQTVVDACGRAGMAAGRDGAPMKNIV